jgi:diguanylate cyclase (GGDEF)-like protein
MEGPSGSQRGEVRDSEHGPYRTPFQTGLRVFAAGAIVSAVVVVASFAVLAPLRAGKQRAGRVARDDLTIEQQCSTVRATLVQWQAFLEPQLDAYQAGGTIFAPADIGKGSQIVQNELDEAKALSTALRRLGAPDRARDLSTAMTAFAATITKLDPLAAGARVTPTQFALIVSNERAAYSRVWQFGATIEQEIAQDTTAPDVRYVDDKIGFAESVIVVVGSILFLLTLAIAAVSSRRAVRRQRRQDFDARHRRYGAELQQALELSSHEGAVYRVVGRALREAVPQLDVELLIADSSRAHFARMLTTNEDPDNAEGCGVVSPRDCPAATRGHTMTFASSDAISACPYLLDRPRGSCSAVCVPVSISGSTVGVLHATGANHVVPSSEDLENLELSARRAAERVALLRAFEKSESQARTDPLTGLLNRRSLENQVRELRGEGIPYAVAYGDLDHFKDLNDTHGHEAGDQALRLFSRVMRDAVRPADLVSRYGGEEFVIVLPDCGTEAATAVLERVRERLAITLTSGRVPGFTVSFGLATSADAANFDEIVAIADRALLQAKSAGRNRVLVATKLAEGTGHD